MAFDIHQAVMDEDGEYDEEATRDYIEQLLDLFAASPEGQKALAEEGNAGWSRLVMDYGVSYSRVTPAEMTPSQLRAVIFDLFPRKVVAKEGDGPKIIRELRAFWTFLGREFKLPNARACLEILDEAAARRLEREMRNPANFGMAKSFFSLGAARGFDMTDPDELQSFTAAYNAELPHSSEPDDPDLPDHGLYGPYSPLPPLPRVQSASDKKAKRKMAQESRKRNRRKK